VARLIRARKAGSPPIVIPTAPSGAVVLEAVKVWPGKDGVRRKVGATASLDSSCARRLRNTAGRAKKRDSRSNKETDQERCAAPKPLDKKGLIQGGPSRKRVDRVLGH